MTKPDPQNKQEFLDFLDELAGIRDVNLDFTEEELANVEPVPLSPEMVERTMQSIREARAITSNNPSPTTAALPQPWWKHPAAALPLSACLLLLAAAPVYFFVWSGRNSEQELQFEDALDVVFDARSHHKTRMAAYVRIPTWIKRGISALKKRAKDSPKLTKATGSAISSIRSMCDAPESVKPGLRLHSGRYREILETLEDGKAGSQAEQLIAVQDFLDLCRSGIEVMYRGRLLGPEYERVYATQLPYIRKRLGK